MPERVTSPARRTQPAWVRHYRAGLIAAEVLGACAVALAVLLTHDHVDDSAVLLVACWGLVAVWPALLAAVGAHSERVFGTGSEEYRRVVRAGLLLLAAAGFVSYAAAIELSRALVAIGVPALTLGTVLLRFAARKILVALRNRGRCTKRVVVVGRGGSVLELMAGLERASYAGLEVVAACVTENDRRTVERTTGLPVGGLEDVLDVAVRHGADTVAVTSASETAAEYLRRLSWQLEGTGLELLVAPGLIEVAGPRLHIRPFEGLPLLTVESPRFEGWRRLVKSGVDRLVAGLAVLLLAPALLAIAAAVRMSSEGPVFFRQERVGIHGRTFMM